jgi:hypothetical protein
LLRLVFVQKDEMQQKERASASGQFDLLWRVVPSSAFIGVGALILLRPVVDHHTTHNKTSANDRVSVVGVIFSAYRWHSLALERQQKPMKDCRRQYHCLPSAPNEKTKRANNIVVGDRTKILFACRGWTTVLVLLHVGVTRQDAIKQSAIVQQAALFLSRLVVDGNETRQKERRPGTPPKIRFYDCT